MWAKQKSVMRPCGKIHFAGVRYAHFVNTDNVTIWYGSVGNYICLKKYSGRRSVKTDDKEKYQLTFLISIREGIMKYIPCVIFKGNDSI